MIPQDSEFYKKLLDHMSDGVYFVDPDRRITYWNEGAIRLTGYSPEEIAGRHCQDDILCHVDYEGKELCHRGCPLAASISDAKGREARVFLRHKQGRRVPVVVRVQPLLSADGNVVGGIEVFSDDTAQAEARRKIEEMKRMAFLDQLTQLPNRRFIEISLHTALSEFHEHRSPFGVLFIDLDRFKEINDSLGHATGDLVLKETAKSLVASFRTTDVVGRWGGDEFMSVVHNTNGEFLSVLARRCVALVARTSVRLPDNQKLSPTVSVGGALIEAEDTVEDLLRRADERLYRSKTEGSSRATAA